MRLAFALFLLLGFVGCDMQHKRGTPVGRQNDRDVFNAVIGKPSPGNQRPYSDPL